jgi:acetyltransferase-like isoleucine patch superfamily enzyme
MIHPTAIIGPKCELGINVSVGPYTIIHDNVQIGDNCTVGSHCEIGVPAQVSDGSPLIIGSGATIRSHSIFYEGSKFGRGLVTGHRVTVRERTVAGDGLQIGTLGDIQGDCAIGEQARFHSNVHIGKHSKIGNYVWIFPYVVLTNDPHPPSNVMSGVIVEDYAAIATMSVVLPGVSIGSGALIGAHSLVTHRVPADTVVVGVPARPAGNTAEIMLKDGSGRPAYPWRRHFHRGYPDAAVARWLEEFGRGAQAADQ